MEINGARRKNATRETTSVLKAWLNEHKKNPYPTKGEKIMLAIITKMTLTQVSTWFANARRRLKKENKMTWEPKNRVDDDAMAADVEDDDDDDPVKDGHDRDLLGNYLFSNLCRLLSGRVMGSNQRYAYTLELRNAVYRYCRLLPILLLSIMSLQCP